MVVLLPGILNGRGARSSPGIGAGDLVGKAQLTDAAPVIMTTLPAIDVGRDFRGGEGGNMTERIEGCFWFAVAGDMFAWFLFENDLVSRKDRAGE